MVAPLSLFGSNNNPGPDNWVDALNFIIQWLNTNVVYAGGGGGGGGGTGTFRPVGGSLVNDTITTADFNGTVAWASNAQAGKLEIFIAGPIGTPVRVTLVDRTGNAGTFGIAAQGSGCTIEGSASTHPGVNGDKGYITYEWDGTSDWVVVG